MRRGNGSVKAVRATSRCHGRSGPTARRAEGLPRAARYHRPAGEALFARRHDAAPRADAGRPRERSRTCVQVLGPLTGDRADHPRGMAWLRYESIRDAGRACRCSNGAIPTSISTAITDADARELISRPSVRTERFPDFRRAVAELALKPPRRRQSPRPQRDVLSCSSIPICSIVRSEPASPSGSRRRVHGARAAASDAATRARSGRRTSGIVTASC